MKRSRDLFENVLESTQDGIVVLNPYLTIRHVNRTVQLWYEEDLPLEGEKCFEVFQKRHEPCEPCPTLRALQGGGMEKDEVQVDSDQGHKWIELYSYPLREMDSETITGVVEFIRDITRRKEGQERLKNSEIRYRRLFESAKDGILILDSSTGRILDVNPYLIELLGYDKGEFLGKVLWDIIPSGYRGEIKEIFQELQEKDYVRFKDLSLKTRSGKVVDVELTSNVYVADVKKVIQCNIRDITSRKELEKQLESSSRQYQSLVENIEEGIVITNTQEEFTFANPAAEKIFGVGKEDLVGRSLKEFVDEEEFKKIRMHTARRMQGETDSYDFLITRPDGEKRILHVTFSPYGEGEVTKILGVLGDVTAERQAEARIQFLSFHDNLTGLYNRAYLEEELKRLDTERQLPISIIMGESREVKVESIQLSLALGVACKKVKEESMREILREAENQMYRSKLAESRSARSAVLSALLKTLEEKSQETEEHVSRMQKMAQSVGEEIGLLQEELNRLTLLASLHDIGNIVISQDILNKPEPLTQDEWDIIKSHTEMGYRIARSTEEIAHVAEDILAHHEHWDGSGYPRGLAGKEIPMLARIVAIVDAYDVMVSGRPY